MGILLAQLVRRLFAARRHTLGMEREQARYYAMRDDRDRLQTLADALKAQLANARGAVSADALLDAARSVVMTALQRPLRPADLDRLVEAISTEDARRVSRGLDEEDA